MQLLMPQSFPNVLIGKQDYSQFQVSYVHVTKFIYWVQVL